MHHRPHPTERGVTLFTRLSASHLRTLRGFPHDGCTLARCTPRSSTFEHRWRFCSRCRIKLDSPHRDVSGVVMSRPKLCFYAMLAIMIAFAAAERLNGRLKESALPDTWANGRVPAGGFGTK